MYFFLNDNCLMVKGAKRGAFYNLKNGSVYSIDQVAVRLVEACGRGERISKVSSRIPGINFEDAVAYLNRLDREGLGNFYSGPREIERESLSYSQETLDFLWLELLDDCNQDCLHCYSRRASGSNGNPKLETEDWIRCVEDAAELSCRALQFIGGEPLLFGEGLLKIAERARYFGYQEVQLFSNLSVLTERWVEAFRDLGIRVSTSIFSDKPEIHDRITGRQGAHKQLLENIGILLDRGIEVGVCQVVMKDNQDCVWETMDFLKDIGIKNPRCEILKPCGNKWDKEMLPDKFTERNMKKDALFPPVSKDTFLRRYNGNSCWQGKVDITSTGDVFPCIMQRQQSCGNVRELPLKDIIMGDELQEFWGLSLDHVEGCRDCEYRYACHDCRPICYGATGDLYSRQPYCLYDPYAGKFAG